MHLSVMANLDHLKIIPKFHNGFCKKRSLKIHDITASLETGDQLDAIFMDFSKAFDSMSHKYIYIYIYIYMYMYYDAWVDQRGLPWYNYNTTQWLVVIPWWLEV